MLESHVDRIDRNGVSGWAFDPAAPTHRVDVLVMVNHKIHASVICDNMRVEMGKSGRYGDGKHGFSYEFPEPLTTDETTCVKIVFARDGRTLNNGEKLFRCERRNGRFQPAMISAAGRSGTTLLMKLLSESPDVCVAGDYPFEVKMFTYYANAFNILTLSRDQATTLNPSEMTPASRVIGPNFYNDLTLPWLTRGNDRCKKRKDASLLIEHFAGTAPILLNKCFRGIIYDYYKTISNINNRASAGYFIEKSNDLQRHPRNFARALFPDLKEVVLVRDPRDLFLSRRDFFKATDDPAETPSGICRELVRICDELGDSVLVVRYEDLVLRRERELSRVSAFLDISLAPMVNADVDRLFSRHGTSISPEDSVGRWRGGLDRHERAMIEDSCAPFLTRFDYM